jgi:spore maturation protein CgeB
MNILYFYNDYQNRRKLYGNMMIKNGHDVKYICMDKNKFHKNDSNKISIQFIKKYKSNIIWLQNLSYLRSQLFSQETLKYLKSNHIPIVVYGTLNTDISYENCLELWKQVDFLFVHSYNLYNFLIKHHPNVYYMPVGFYPDQYNLCLSKQKLDISFCGSRQTTVNNKLDKRIKYLLKLRKYDIKVYGKSFKNELSNIQVYPIFTHKEHKKVFSKTKINLDLPFINSPLDFYNNMYHIKNRFFEVPSTGNFLLTIKCPEFLNIFDESMVGYYDDNIDSLKESVNKYLKDKTLRKKMSELSYKVVHEKHTFMNRFKEMFKILKQNM